VSRLALPSSTHFVRAESLFTRALTIGRALNDTALTNAALGRARVYANQTMTRREVTVWNTVWVADRDPRALHDSVKTGATNFFRQRKYLTLGDPVALAQGH